MRATHCQESLDADFKKIFNEFLVQWFATCHDEVDTGAEADSVGGVVEVGKEGVGEEVVVDPVEVHPQHLQDGEHNVQAVRDVEGGEDIVEAVAPHVFAQQDHNTHKVPKESKTTKSWKHKYNSNPFEKPFQSTNMLTARLVWLMLL